MPSPEPIIVPTHTKLYTQLVEKFASFSWSLTLRYAIYAVGTLLILWLVSKILQKVLRHLHQIKGEYICLEVTPPQITEDSSKSITGLFTQIAGLVAKAKSLAATSMGYVDDHNTPPRKEARRATADRG